MYISLLLLLPGQTEDETDLQSDSLLLHTQTNLKANALLQLTNNLHMQLPT
jgi:hypothetical protein